MSFRDFNDEGPGSFAWDYVLGHNTTGLFPDETHYIIDGDVLEEVTFSYAGGESWNTYIGNCWNITNVKPLSGGELTFEQDGVRFKASVNKKLKMKGGMIIYDIFKQ